jgi:hypothetical protein
VIKYLEFAKKGADFYEPGGINYKYLIIPPRRDGISFEISPFKNTHSS